MAISIQDYRILYGAVKYPKTRVKEMNFGMGYRQIVVDGPNSDEEGWDIIFRPMSDSTSIITLENILLDSVKSTSNFLSWIPPNETETKYYTAQDVKKEAIGGNWWRLSCTLRREFLPV